MIKKAEFPIQEFDSNKEALINPSMYGEKTGLLGCDKLIISFFKDAIEALKSEGKIKLYKTIFGGDDVSQEVWDMRAGTDRKGIRYSLIEICKDIVSLI